MPLIGIGIAIFSSNTLAFSSPPNKKIKIAASIIKQNTFNDPIFIFTITNNGDILYSVNLSSSADILKAISPKTKENILAILKAMEAKYKLELKDNDVAIAGDEGFLYQQFKIIKQALKEKGVFKFQFINNATNKKKNDTKPENEIPETIKINAVHSMTLLLAANNRLFYYQGAYKNVMIETDYTKVRKVIIAFLKKTKRKDLMFLIKSDSAASFKNIIDLLDEMVICKVPKGHYAEVDITENEKQYMQSVTSK
jgi:biopolymer transport protein ExbD